MKLGLVAAGMLAVLVLSACGGGVDNAHKTNTDAALQRTADVTKAALQEKADALARDASMSPLRSAGSTGK